MKTVDEARPEIEIVPEEVATLHEESEGAVMVEEQSSEQPCAGRPLSSRIEALLISSDRPLTEPRLVELLGMSGSGATSSLRQAVDELNKQLRDTGRAFRAERLAGGWQMLTLAEYGDLLARLHRERQQSRLSQAALETLAIVAYRTKDGGILRAEIEAIRGVSCGEVLRTLMDRRLVKIVGRAEVPGRPMLYGVTKEFLKVFGLASLDDLPEVEGLPGNRSVKRKLAGGESESATMSSKSATMSDDRSPEAKAEVEGEPAPDHDRAED